MQTEAIKRAQGGDIEAFEELYRENSDFVWRVVIRMVGNEEDAKDLTQDIFIKVFHELPKYRFEAQFSTWLYRVAFTTTLNHLKKNKSRRGKTEEIYRTNDQIRGGESGLTDERAVTLLLSGLNPLQKSCVILRDIEGGSYEEVAEILKIKIGTVRSNLNRARHKMRDNWLKKGGGDQ